MNDQRKNERMKNEWMKNEWIEKERMNEWRKNKWMNGDWEKIVKRILKRRKRRKIENIWRKKRKK